MALFFSTFFLATLNCFWQKMGNVNLNCHTLIIRTVATCLHPLHPLPPPPTLPASPAVLIWFRSLKVFLLPTVHIFSRYQWEN